MIQNSLKTQSYKQENDEPTEITSFEQLPISVDLLRGIYAYGFQKPSYIQSASIGHIVKGRDLIAQSQAGTGKTAAFVVGGLQNIDQESDNTQVIILTPTRQLSYGIYSVIKQLAAFTKIRVEFTVGGIDVRQNRKRIKQNRPQLIIGTPGRISDFIQKKIIVTDHLKMVILDEADEMLSRGFLEQVKQIFEELPADTQTCLFSATMPEQVVKLTEMFMKDPVKILLKAHDVPVQSIKQFTVCMENYEQKFPTMVQIYKNISITQSIIFANSKEKVTEIANKLIQLKFPVTMIHSDVDNRTQALAQFKSGEKRILVSTDLMGRGIDISQVALVINYDLPHSSIALQQYIHRIGRCGRYGKQGVAINLLTEGDAQLIVKIQKHYNIEIPELPLNLEKVFG